MLRKIDLTKLVEGKLDPEQSRILGEYIAQSNLEFIDSKKVHNEHLKDSFSLTNHLILDQENQEKNKKIYYVIANDPEKTNETNGEKKPDDQRTDLLGRGSFSTAKKIIGKIEVDLESKKAIYLSVPHKAVRIKNPTHVQKKREKNSKLGAYNHQQAVEEYEKHLPFKHIGMQEPIEVKRSEENIKSYIVMNELPGRSLFKEVSEFIGIYNSDPDFVRPTTREVIESVILPFLKKYNEQIASTNRVHRDLKEDNVRIKIDKRKDIQAQDIQTEVNFFDLDENLEIGSDDTTFGTPGYVAPESQKEGNKVKRQRDIFSLGVMLIGCFNPRMLPDIFFKNMDNENALKAAHALVEKKGWYNLDGQKIGNDEEESTLFEWMSDPETMDHFKIMDILSKMTANDPDARYDNVADIIEKFESISKELTLREDLQEEVEEEQLIEGRSENNSGKDEVTSNELGKVKEGNTSFYQEEEPLIENLSPMVDKKKERSQKELIKKPVEKPVELEEKYETVVGPRVEEEYYQNQPAMFSVSVELSNLLTEIKSTLEEEEKKFKVYAEKFAAKDQTNPIIHHRTITAQKVDQELIRLIDNLKDSLRNEDPYHLYKKIPTIKSMLKNILDNINNNYIKSEGIRNHLLFNRLKKSFRSKTTLIELLEEAHKSLESYPDRLDGLEVKSYQLAHQRSSGLT